MSAPRRAGGFTLMEVLVALFVLSIGMLGCASLLTWSLFQHGSALRRELALSVASDLAERVRANGAAPDAGTLAEWRAQASATLPMLAGLESTLEVFAPASPAELERIDITLRWREPRVPEGIASLVVRIHRSVTER